VAGVAIRTTDVVAPVFPAPEVVVLFLAGVAAETCFRDLFRRLVLERDYLCGIAFLDVGFARTMTRFTACDFSLPTGYAFKLGMRGMGKSFELVLVTGFASLSADVVLRHGDPRFGRTNRRRLRWVVVAKPTDRGGNEHTDQECFNK
jgi:hypothetical protein